MQLENILKGYKQSVNRRGQENSMTENKMTKGKTIYRLSKFTPTQLLVTLICYRRIGSLYSTSDIRYKSRYKSWMRKGPGFYYNEHNIFVVIYDVRLSAMPEHGICCIHDLGRCSNSRWQTIQVVVNQTGMKSELLK